MQYVTYSVQHPICCILTEAAELDVQHGVHTYIITSRAKTYVSHEMSVGHTDVMHAVAPCRDHCSEIHVHS